MATETGVAVVPLEGFSNWGHVEPFGWLVRNLLEGSVTTFVVLDRDYRSDTAADGIVDRLAELDIRAHVWKRKELESYLLVPSAIARITKASLEWVENSLNSAALAMANSVFARALDQKLREDVSAARHRITVTEAYQRRFDEEWTNPVRRLEICPPKELIRAVNRELANEKRGQISARAIARSIRPAEVPSEMRDLLLDVEKALA